MEEEKEFETPAPVVIPDEAPAEEHVEEPVVEPAEPKAEVPEEPSVADTPPIEVTSPEMVKNEVPSEEPVKVEEPKEKKKVPAALCVVIVLLVLLCGGYFYLRMTHTAEKLLENSLTKAENSIKLFFDTYKAVDFNTTDSKIDGTLSVDGSGDLFSYFNNMDATYDVGVSLKNNYLYANLKLSQDDVSSDVKAVIDDKTLYADLGDIFAKKLFMENEESFFTELKGELSDSVGEINASTADLEYQLTHMIKYAKEALKLSKMETKYEGLKVTYTYVIDDSNMNIINDRYVEQCKADAKLMELLENETPRLVSTPTKFVLTTGLIDGKLESLDVESDGDSVKVTKKEANHYLVQMKTDDEVYNADVTVKGTEYTAKLTDKDNKDYGTLVIDSKGNKSKVSYSYKNEEYDGAITVETTVASKDKYIMKVTGALAMDSEKVNFDLLMNVESKEGLITKNIPEGAVALNTLSEAELEQLQTNAVNRISKYKFYTLVEALTAQDDDYDYGYDYE